MSYNVKTNCSKGFLIKSIIKQYHKRNYCRRNFCYFFESAKIAEKYDILDRLGTSYNNIGKIYLENEELEKAKSYFSDALNILIAEEDFFFAAFVYNNLSEVDLVQLHHHSPTAFSIATKPYFTWIIQNS